LSTVAFVAIQIAIEAASVAKNTGTRLTSRRT
jgi:hypothetical protein